MLGSNGFVGIVGCGIPLMIDTRDSSNSYSNVSAINPLIVAGLGMRMSYVSELYTTDSNVVSSAFISIALVSDSMFVVLSTI
jgi:hypothetical protein